MSTVAGTALDGVEAPIPDRPQDPAPQRGVTGAETGGPADRSADAADGTGHAASDGAGDEAEEHTGEHGAPSTAPVRTPATLAAAGDLLRALAAPVRIAIVLQLREADQCVHDLVDALGVTQPLISQHLRVLKSAGVVHGERRGREVIYSLVDEHLSHIVVDAVAHAEEGR